MANEKVIEIFKAANVYDLDDLVNEMANRLSHKIVLENVFNIYEQVHEFGNIIIQKKVLEMIQKMENISIYKQSIKTINRSMMELILNRHITKIAENQLFDFLVDWTLEQIQDTNSVGLRETMGNLLYLVRIPSMDSKLFLNAPATSLIFTPQEVQDILYYQILDSKPVNGIVSHFQHLEKRFSKPLIFSGPNFPTFQNESTTVKTNKTHLVSLRNNLDICLNEIVLKSEDLTDLTLSIVIGEGGEEKEGNEILSTKMISLAHQYFIANLIVDCPLMKANTTYSIMVQFKETNLIYSKPSAKFEQRLSNQFKMIFESDERIQRAVRLTKLEVFV